MIKAKLIGSLLKTIIRNTALGLPLVGELNLVATNRCSQRCSMCNAAVLTQERRAVFTLELFRRYTAQLTGYRIPTLGISGGEPTLVPELPEIMRAAAGQFSKITLMTNLYGNTERIRQIAACALECGVDIICSFDGFGEVADQLRGARDVSRIVSYHVRMISALKCELRSPSLLMLNTVISDANLHQVPNILSFSRGIGWTQGIAPVNKMSSCLLSQDIPNLSYSEHLVEVCALAAKADHVTTMRSFIRGIPAYARKEHPKICPYLTKLERTFKIFLEPNGDVSLCDRVPIGNLNHATLKEVLSGASYRQAIARFESCSGCWLQCFTEPVLVFQPSNLLRLDFRHRVVSERKPVREEKTGPSADTATLWTGASRASTYPKRYSATTRVEG